MLEGMERWEERGLNGDGNADGKWDGARSITMSDMTSIES
jgi:hypothetical protein